MDEGLHSRVRSVPSHHQPGRERVDASGLVLHGSSHRRVQPLWGAGGALLEQQHTLRQPGVQIIWGLVINGDEVWGAVGEEVVVWDWLV